MSALFFPFLLLFSLFCPCPLAQQAYPTADNTMDCKNSHPDNAGYVCEPSKPSCDTLAYFRVQSGSFSTLNAIATQLFNTSSSAIATSSNLSSANAQLSVGEGLYIPLACTCYGNHTSQNVTYTIANGDTFSALANGTYEGLTTCQAIQDANPSAVVNNLQIGQKVILPIRCACPSAQQQRRNITTLVTYPVGDHDNITSIINMFSNLSEQEFLAANDLANTSVPLFPATTVLLPFIVKPTTVPNATSSSSSTSSSTPSSSSSSSSSSSKTGIYIGVAVAVVAVLLIMAAVAFLVRKTKKKGAYKENLSPPNPSPIKPSTPLKNLKLEHDLFEGMSNFASSEKLATYTLEEIKQATQNFSPSTQIKGAVYRGVMKGRIVAVKNMTRNVSKELQILQKVHHANLVTLLGTCITSREQSYLVYDYAENGSLSDWLHDNDFSMGSRSSSTLTWNNRLQVAVDVARALEYIHEHTNPSYVHKDIKSSNILLDSKFRGKLANFGLAKSTEDMEPRTRHIVGTQGYMAPEYMAHGMVSPKIDVFAFGVILLEILSGEEAMMRDRVGKEKFLSEAITALLSDTPDGKERLKAWMDPCLQNAYPLDCAYNMAILARSCVADDPLARPSARTVAYTLAKMLEVSLEWESSDVLEDYDDNHLEAR